MNPSVCDFIYIFIFFIDYNFRKVPVGDDRAVNTFEDSHNHLQIMSVSIDNKFILKIQL